MPPEPRGSFMGLRPVVPLLVLASLLAAAQPASALQWREPPPCVALGLLARVDLPTAAVGRNVTLHYVGTGRSDDLPHIPGTAPASCHAHDRLDLATVVDADGVTGLLSITVRPAPPGVPRDAQVPTGAPPPAAAAVPHAPEATAPAAAPGGPSTPATVEVSLRVHVATAGHCADPVVDAVLRVNEVQREAPAPGPIAASACAFVGKALGPHAAEDLVHLARALADAVAGSAPDVAPHLAAPAHALALAASTFAAPPGLDAAATLAPLADVHPDDGGGVALDGAADAVAAPDAAVLAAQLGLDTPYTPRAGGGAEVEVARDEVLAGMPHASPSRPDADRPDEPAPDAPVLARARAAPSLAPHAPRPPPPANAAPRGEDVDAPEPPAPADVDADAHEGPPSVPTPVDFAARAMGAVAVGGALVVMFAALYQRVQRPRALDHPRRRAVHDALQRSEHARTAADLAAHLGVERKTVEYHLRYLVRLGLLATSRREDGATLFRVPAASAAPPPDPLAEALARLVHHRPGLTTGEAASSLALTRPRAERRLRDLLLAGRIESTLLDGERKFYPAGMPPLTKPGGTAVALAIRGLVTTRLT